MRTLSASVFAPIELNNTYRMATTNVVLGGGDAYAVVTQGQNKSETGIMLVDHFAENSPVSAAVDGRITVANSIHLPLAAHGTSAR